MKKVIPIIAILWSACILEIKGQAVLSIDTTLYGYTNPTSLNTIDTFTFVIGNTGSQAYSGIVHIAIGADTSGTANLSGMQLVQEDSLSVNMLPGDTMNRSAGVTISSTHFRHGINTVVIWPRARGSANFITADSLKLSLLIDTASGVDHHLSLTLSPKLFPNPASQVVYVVFTDPNMSIEQVRYLTPDGRLVREERFNGKLDLSTFANGTYFIEFMATGGRSVRYKVVKE